MGGPGSGGSNKKSIEQHILNGTYRQSRHGGLSAVLQAYKKLVKERRSRKSR